METLQRLVLATGNPGKTRELRILLQPLGIELVSQAEYGVVDCEETGLSFVENAILKARNAAEQTGLPALADDSGLEVDALQGQPGIYSARYAGPDGDDLANNRKLLAAMQAVAEPGRGARFRCVMAFLRHARDPSPLLTEGTWEGSIARDLAGSGGFGYDVLFHVPGYGVTSAELPAEVKNALSHRGQAVRAMVEHLRHLRQASLPVPPGDR
jgi:XTP/dITP diphosphohydrolase